MHRLIDFIIKALGATLAVAAVLVVLAPRAHAQGENDPRMREAMQRFPEAEQLFESGNASAALAEFQHIYELLDGHPRQFFVLFNMGRCYEALFRYDEALTSYNNYLEHGGAAEQNAAEVRATLRVLENRLSVLQVATNVDRAEVWVDGHNVGNAPGDVRVTVGNHTVELRAEGYASRQAEVSIASRAVQQITMNLTRLSDFSGLSPGFFFAGVGLTAVAAALGLGWGIAAIDLRGQVLGAEGARRAELWQDAVYNEIESLALTADILFIVAGGLGIATIVMLLLTDWGSETEVSANTSSSSAIPRFTPFATTDAAGLVLDWRL